MRWKSISLITGFKTGRRRRRTGRGEKKEKEKRKRKKPVKTNEISQRKGSQKEATRREKQER